MLRQALSLRFRHPNMERAFWTAVISGPFRRFELAGMSIWLTFTIFSLSGCSVPKSWEEAVVQSWPHALCFGTFCCALFHRKLYERYHDWMIAALRLASHLSTYGSMIYGPSRNVCSSLWATNPVMLLASLTVAFGAIRSLIDSVRFPLRFRHHVLVQLTIALIRSKRNWTLCGECFKTQKHQDIIFDACSWSTLATSGVWADCRLAEFGSACFTFSLQLHAILGLIATSFVVYVNEVTWRKSFSWDVKLADEARHHLKTA